MKAPVLLILALALAAQAACDRSGSGAPPNRAGGDAITPAEQRTRDALSAAERASAAGEPDTASPGTLPTGDAAPQAPAGPSAAPPSPRSPAPSAAGNQATLADSAGRILERAADRYAAVSTMQADFSMTYENPLLRSRTTGAGTLFQKRPDRLLLRFSEPAGDVILSDGRYFWVYYPSVDAQQVLRSAASPGASSGVDLQAQFLGDPTRRFNYTLDGEEPVGGRSAWLFTLKPRERLGYRQLRVWIDERDYLARRFEITEDNGSVRRFELRNLRIGAALADDLFQFRTPTGARVITR